jgi:restriction system protein
MAADDVEVVQQFAARLSDIDAPVVTTTDGAKVSLLWAAALFDAEGIACWLVRQGADPRTQLAGASPVDIAVGNGKRAALRGMVRGGFIPDRAVLWALMKEPQLSDVPLSARQAIARRLSSVPGFEEISADLPGTCDQIIRCPLFRESYPDLAELVDGPAARREVAATADELALGFVIQSQVAAAEVASAALAAEASMLAFMLCYGRSLLISHASELVGIAREEFYGIRNNRKWIERALARASARLCEDIVSERIGVYSDDPRAVEMAGFAISLLPIGALIEGMGQSEATSRNNDGRSFELECAELLRASGFLVSHIGGAGDQGGDLKATKEGRSFVIQCKDQGGPVGNASVQEAGGARAFYGADYAVVCSRNGFTKAAHVLARKSEVLLLLPGQLHDIDTLARIFD